MTPGLISTRSVAFGRPASEALAQAVQAAKSGDPLAPVTVVVPSNLANLTARRLLASGALASDLPGIANVTFVTPYELAAVLGAGTVAASGQRPVTDPVLAAAVRAVLQDEPHGFDAVRMHAATEEALVRVYGELSRVRPGTLDELEAVQGGLVGDVVRVYRAVRARLDEFHDEDDLARAAADALREQGTSVDGLGEVVLHLLAEVSPAIGDVLEVLVERVPVQAIVGLTGEDAADAAARRLVERLGGEPAPSVPPALATAIVSAADPDEEVRMALRRILALAEEGTPLDRVALLYPSVVPYARIVQQQLDGADVPWNGPGVRTLADSMAGRVLVRVLRLVDGGMNRDAVVELLAAGPVLDLDGRLAPAAAWDRLSRLAGVTGDVDDWCPKLAHHRDQLRERLERRDDPSEAFRSYVERETERLLSLEAFVDQLHADVESPPASWEARSTWARDLMGRLLGPGSRRTQWPELEQQAADRVEDALDRLSVLDSVDPDAPFDVFVRAVTTELDRTIGRTGRFGEGLLVGALAMAPGLDVDAVVVVGLAEGMCPAPRREDPLLPDRARSITGPDELSERDQRLESQHRDLLAALASARHERVLTRPAGDPRTGRGTLASRWLLEQAGSLRGQHVYSSEFDHVDHPAVGRVPSFVAGLRDRPAALDPADHDLALLMESADTHGSVATHPMVQGDTGLRLGFEAVAARSSPAFTRWDGNLAGASVGSPLDAGTLSATVLERWATCPRRYLLSDVLRVQAVDRPEELEEMEPRERGNLFHDILERFLAAIVELPPAERPHPDQPWTEADRERLVEVADELFAEYEARGVTGRPALWRVMQREALTDLEQFLRADNRLRRTSQTVPEAVELTFGRDGHPPVRMPLADGREVALRGRIDRVDLRTDGVPVVYDYKSGRDDPRRTDPVERGTKLQLPVYGAAARERHGSSVVGAYYWYVTRRGKYRSVGGELDEVDAQRVLDVLTVIVEGIEADQFPAHAGEHDWFRGTGKNCTWCEYDRLCSRDRFDEWEATSQAGELAAYVTLVDVEWERPT